MTQLTNTLRKTVASLDNVRHRHDLGLFKAEGSKCVADMMPWFDTHWLLATGEWLDMHPDMKDRAVMCTARDMERMSSMVTPPGVIAVMSIPQHDFRLEDAGGNLVLALDAIRDPGNLGTIIRVADWFGINDIICSTDTVDCYAPKVVQATMGSLARVAVHYLDLAKVIGGLALRMPVYGTFLDGEPLWSSEPCDSGVIVIGNESHGISDAVASSVTARLTIPSYPCGAPTGESLNAAVATAITVASFRRHSWQRKK